MATMDEQEQRRRRLTAWRGSRRVPARVGADGTLGERLAAPAADASSVHDPDDWTDVYGGGVVADLERRVARLLGMEAAAFFPTGTMTQQVALRCWAGRTGDAAVALHPSPSSS